MNSLVKKVVVMLTAVCMASVFAGSKVTSTLLFNRPQFQAHQATADTPPYMLTVPLVYKGTMSFEINIMDNAESVCIDDEKGKWNLYMTMCQPCIDCYPCQIVEAEKSDSPLPMTEYGEAAVNPGKITKWNLYIVKETKKAKLAQIYKIDLTETEECVFFTGNNKGNAVVQGVTSPYWFFAGKKSDYKFKYADAQIVDDDYNWELTGKKDATAYIKSIASANGKYAFALTDKDAETGASLFASISLTRDSSLTKTAVSKVFSTVIDKKAPNWEDCGYATPAGVCEAYYNSEWDIDNDGMDAYLESLYDKKKWEVEASDAGSLQEVFIELL